MAAPLAGEAYTITLPAQTFVVMGDQNAVLPFTLGNDAGSPKKIDTVQMGVPESDYWISTATSAPDGWSAEIKNAGAGQAWVRFQALSPADAIAPGASLVFNVIVTGNKFDVFTARDRDWTDALEFVTVEGEGTLFTRSGPLPGWQRKALAARLTASPSSLGTGKPVIVAMDVSNRSSVEQAGVIPTATLIGGSGGVTLATGPVPPALTIPFQGTASFTWTFTSTAAGDVVWSQAASNGMASSAQVQSNPIFIGDFTAGLDLDPTQVISGQQATLVMIVQNNAASVMTDVTPSAVGQLGAATMIPISGPTPPNVASLAPGAARSFQWVYRITGDIGATFQFTGAARAGSGVRSNAATSPQGEIKKYTVSVAPRAAPAGTTGQAFTYVVANNGGLPVKAVEFTLPSDFTYVGASGGYGGHWAATHKGGNPETVLFEAPSVPADALPVGLTAAFVITFNLPLSAGDYAFPVRIVDTADGADGVNAIVALTEYEVKVEAWPASGIPADGSSISIITATVTRQGIPQQGKVVYFYTSNGTLSPGSSATNGSGVATTSLVAPLSSANTSALVTARCQGAQDAVIIRYVAYVSKMTDLAVVKTVTPTLSLPGQLVTYSLALSNAGAYTATGVILTDSVPVGAGFMPVRVVSRGLAISDTGYSPAYVWRVQDLAPGASGRITITGVLSPGRPAGYVLTNTATLATATQDANLANNMDSAAVTMGNAAPAASDDAYRTLEDTRLTIAAPGVLGNDSDPNRDILTAVKTGDPAGGVLTLNVDGSFVYTPALNLNGAITFTYQANDGRANSNTAAVTLIITPVNDAPAAGDDAASTLKNKPVVVRVLDNDTDPEDEPLSVAAVGTPGDGVATTNGVTVTYTPALDFTGTDVFTYTAADGHGGLATARVIVSVIADQPPAYVYLPVIMNQIGEPDAPDLVVERIVAASNTVQVVIKNRGSAPVTSTFWVDFYVAPNPVPTGVNQVWNDGRSTQGIVWGVYGDALSALVPGGVLTLTVGDALYWADQSHIDWPLPAGTPVYAQVDSANMNTTYGAVRETHEIAGGPYNNILGPVYSITIVSGVAGPSPASGGQLDRPRPYDAMPPRP